MVEVLTFVPFNGFLVILSVQLPLLWLCHVFLDGKFSFFGCATLLHLLTRAFLLCLHLRRVPHKDRVCLHLTTLQSSILPSFLQQAWFRVRGSVANLIWGLVGFQRLSVQASPNRRLFRWKILLASQIRCESSLYLLLLISLFVYFLCFFVSFQDDS